MRVREKNGRKKKRKKERKYVSKKEGNEDPHALYLVCVSAVTASSALHRMSRDLSMSHAHEGSIVPAAISRDVPNV